MKLVIGWILSFVLVLLFAPVVFLWRWIFGVAGLPVADWAWTAVYLLAVSAHVVLSLVLIGAGEVSRS